MKVLMSGLIRAEFRHAVNFARWLGRWKMFRMLRLLKY